MRSRETDRTCAASPGEVNVTTPAHPDQQAPPHNGATRPPCNGTAAVRARSARGLLALHDDVFHYVCAFVPLHDLLSGLALVSREAWQRVSANHALWQQLWMRYLHHFCVSLIPAATPRSAAVCAGDGPSMLHPSTPAVDHHHNRRRDTSWNLFHFHHSTEASPHAVQLESLCVMREDVADPCAASVSSAGPTAAAAGAAPMVATTGPEMQAELLRFAQACATQTVARNLTHSTTAAATSSSTSRSPASAGTPATRAAAVQSPLFRDRGHPRRVRKHQQRHINRLQRVLHFLLSADGRRPQFHDGLWTATHEAELAYLRRTRGGSDAASDADAARREHARSPTRKRPPHRSGPGQNEPAGLSTSASAKVSSPRALPPPARLRPMSWLDSDAASVKVLLFDDDTRSVGDAAAVHAERAKLLASLADNWRTAYAAHFYPCPTDGKDPGSAAPRGPSPTPQTRTAASLGASVVGMPSVTLADRTPRTPVPPPAPAPLPTAPAAQSGAALSSGHAGWEQVYRRFRDGHNGPERRRNSAGSGDDGGALDDAAPLPSSSSPLFDLHLLGYTRRKQVYAAMLASTVEVPEGMGAFFATCVSGAFLRWWCSRSRRLRATGDPPGSLSASASLGNTGRSRRQQQPQPPPPLPQYPRRSLAMQPFHATGGGESALPHFLWVVRAALPRSGAAQLAHNPLRGPAPGAENSVAYSSSYSDMTTTSSTSDEDVVEVEAVEGDTSEAAAGAFDTSPVSTSSIVFVEDASDEGGGGGAAAEATTAAVPTQPSPPPSCGDPVALLFPLPHMLAYWFMMHHVSFYNYQVYRRTWGDQDLTIAVCSRILSPTGHSVECRLFYSLRCATFPRMFTKMMFTPGVLPSLTLQGKMTERSPYHSDSDRTSSASSTTSTSNSGDSNSGFSATALDEPFTPASQGGGGGSFGSASASTTGKPVDSRQIYDLFWTGFGRVEVECGPTISRSNLVRLRIALGLPADFPMGLLWNVVMFASGLGPRILKEHRHSLHFNYAKTFTDVVAEEFGELECYGLGAQPPHKRNDAAAMANPLDIEAAEMRERHMMEAMARVVTQELAGLGGTRGAATNGGGAGVLGRRPDSADSSGWTGTSPLSATSYGSWNIDSEFSSAEGAHASRPLSDTSSSGYL